MYVILYESMLTGSELKLSFLLLDLLYSLCSRPFCFNFGCVKVI